MTTDPIGGVWNFTAQLAASLCGGNEVALISFGRALCPEQDAWVCGMNTAHLGCFQFHACTAPLEWMPNNDETHTGIGILQQVAATFKPDLFHTNQFCWGGTLALPTVITAHSDVLSWAAACNPQALTPTPWLTRYTSLVKTGLAAADAVVSPTHWMQTALTANFTLPARSEIILNGTTLHDQYQTALPRQLQAVTAGRLWDEAKNLTLFKHLQSPIPLLIAGEDHLAEASATLPSCVQALGHLTQSDLHTLFRRSALYICPSLYEPFGLAPLEAALCGCALLLHDVHSLREIWAGAALYFTSAESLQHLLTQLAADPKAIVRTQQTCSARAAELSTARMAAAYRTVYNSLMPAGATAHAF